MKGREERDETANVGTGRHGMINHMDLTPGKVRRAGSRRFGELFPEAPPLASDPENLIELGRRDGPIYETEDDPIRDSDAIPAAYTFYGQFVDHDITLDVQTSLVGDVSDPTEVRNIRNPTLRLDSLYGEGPEASRHLYDQTSEKNEKLLTSPGGFGLARNRQGTALIGDPRNDENLFVSKIQLAFIRFHNHVFEKALSGSIEIGDESPFEYAQRVVRWTHQWIIVNEFLPLTVGGEDGDDGPGGTLVDEILYGNRGRGRGSNRKLRPTLTFYPMDVEPFIPVEFAVAAYRFGHSQARVEYEINDDLEPRTFFELRPEITEADDPIEAEPPHIDWSLQFGGGEGQYSREIDTRLADPLGRMDGFPEKMQRNSLAARNLVRGDVYNLPSGEELARRMGIPPGQRVSPEAPAIETEETPAWYYMLAEAEAERTDRLGPVAGRIVAETLLGVLLQDDTSYLSNEPNWSPPFIETSRLEESGEYVLEDLLTRFGSNVE